MNSSAQVLTAVVGGYALGRTRKARLALTLAGALAGKRMNSTNGLRAVLDQSPEVARLTERLRGELTEALKAAAVNAATHRLDTLASGLQAGGDRADDVVVGETADDAETAPEDSDEAPDDASNDDSDAPTDEADDAEEDAPRTKQRSTSRRSTARSGEKSADRPPAKKASGNRRTQPAKKAPSRSSAAAKKTTSGSGRSRRSAGGGGA
ncbi:hypothetical protein PZ938_14995 [Luteipulveratus sp. YIM 133132]|uniref:hypothetical protein n=1 Tax=Luteipulveratus flavus TaxID=3031728 RepID=UPI0023B0959F|nr:hypothetical protein [Luteipulveratus sp. YIM 133132]MDE9366921.1 hypothetical protein [Luteipulveratus sp. YIM 133132]